MAYMVYQQYATAVRDAYRHARADEVLAHLAEARHARAWVESLGIDPVVRAALAEPLAVVEDALAGIAGPAPTILDEGALS